MTRLYEVHFPTDYQRRLKIMIIVESIRRHWEMGNLCKALTTDNPKILLFIPELNVNLPTLELTITASNVDLPHPPQASLERAPEGKANEL